MTRIYMVECDQCEQQESVDDATDLPEGWVSLQDGSADFCGVAHMMSYAMSDDDDIEEEDEVE